MAEPEINVNEIVGHAAADLVESFFSNVGASTKDQIAKYKIRFGKGFKRYLTESLDRYSRFKTLINRYDAVDLNENYVPARVFDEGKSIREEDFFDKIIEDKRIIVEGTAGLGKTLFVRQMFRHAIVNQRDFIPILFELRNLHLDNTLSLMSNLAKQVSDYIPGFNEEHFKFGLEKGKFAIFLDGIDEISFADRSRYAAEILDLAYRYTDTPILLSTRPDDFYLPWEVFRVAKLLPMKREQTLLMLQKLKYDPDVKGKFISHLTVQYFDDHSEFLSVPLLATLMMLTFSEFSAVPSRMYVFYEQAFQTLFHKHDFIKGAYSRKIESGLDVEEFRRLLSAFCFISYIEERFSFLQYQAMENIKAAIKLVGVECDPEEFLKDLLVTVCLLQRDGNSINFVHRSFQEYFTALFVISSPPSDIFEIIEELMFRGKVDAVINMTMQLNDGVMEQEWVLPKLRAMNAVLKGAENSNLGYVTAAFGQPKFHRGLVFEREGMIDWNTFRFLIKTFGSTAVQPNEGEEFYDDAGTILRYVNVQRELAEREEAHNKPVLAARKRELRGDSFKLSILPVSMVEGLRCIRLAAEALRELAQIQENLEAKQNQKSQGIRRLLSKYKR